MKNDKVLAQEEKLIPAPVGTEAHYPQGFRMLYKLVERIGHKGATLICAESEHYDVATGRMISYGSIKNSENPDIAWEAYRNAIKNNEWGKL